MRWDQDLFKRGLDFAARAHGAQAVPGSGFPYVVHVTKVATEVLLACQDGGLEPNLAMACALLHDTIEDAGVTEAQLAAEFGLSVALGVKALTKDPAVSKAHRMEDSLRRIRHQPREVWAVKLADRVTNLEPPPPAWSLEKRRAYLAEAHVILAELRGGSPVLEARLLGKATQYERYCAEESAGAAGARPG
jgi:(p)ppGpp synthase/HD superfamily hydrolase